MHGPGADIDTLCVGPSYVNREVTLCTRLLLMRIVFKFSNGFIRAGGFLHHLA